jgi:uncharacterized membrane protein
MYYINYFFLYAIIGHFIETVFTKGFNSGILYGWWTPVYGFGVVLILLIGKLIGTFPLKEKRLFKIFITYLSCMIILTLIELIGGYLIEFIFHQEFWNYEHYKFHIGPYISLEVANMWGIAGITVLYLLKPISDKIVSKVPIGLTYILLILIFIDTTITIFLK